MVNETVAFPALSKEELFLKNSFKKFYEKNFVKEPPFVERREFGFGIFGKKISQRHLSFSSLDKMNSFLREQVPFYFSYSTAHYKFPDARPMDAKRFLQSDIIYEFDADDLKLDCRSEHDLWNCTNCSASGKGAIENCTNCGEKVSVKQWFCENCLEEVKKQVFSLLDFLEKDFNFSEGISINFSGNAGYHIHLRSEKIQKLSHNARIELLDYLTAYGLNLESQGFIADDRKLLCPKPNSFGWSKKISQGLIDFLKNSSSEKIAAIGGLKFSKANREFLEKKDSLIEWIEKKGSLYSIPGGIDANKKFWLSIAEQVVKEQSLNLDRQTSIDLNKIVRVPETLHGSTGLIAKNVSIEDLKNFAPFNDCVVFSNVPVKVFISDTPRFNLSNETFGPFNGEKAELPEFAAIYLIGKNLAKLP